MELSRLQSAGLLLGFVITLYAISLWRNIRKARATGLPYVVTPLLETEVLAQILTPLLRAIYHNYLDKGTGWPSWCRFIVKDWSWEDKRIAHELYGDVFICVSARGLICYCADAAMAWDVMNRRYDFTKPRDKYKLLEPYGPNVATAEGANYRFHVRITAPPFSDVSGVNNLVWNETVEQTVSLMDTWGTSPPIRLQDEINALTLAVIAVAGFGKPVKDISESNSHVPAGHAISFLRAIADTTKYIVAILLFPGWFLRMTPLSKADLARQELDKYLREMIRAQRRDLENGGANDALTAAGPRGNLLHAVVKASFDEAKNKVEQNSGSTVRHAFSEDEVMGNLFIYLLAGYETTANAIAYGIFALSLHLDVQQRVIDEIDMVWRRAAEQGREQPTYKDDFSQLVYTFGFMYETFRLYPGVTLITKMCKTAQWISVDDELQSTRHQLPPECRVYLSAPAIHYHEKYWPEAKVLRPERWMEGSASMATDWGTKEDSTNSANAAADKSRQMRGRLLTFSDGSRACLGRKFAQAEFIAFFATLLRTYRVGLPDGADPAKIKAQLDLKSAGMVTLAPVSGLPVRLIPRTEKALSK